MRKYNKKHKKWGKYKSPLEQKVAKKLGKKAVYEPEKLVYFLEKKYTPDFVVTHVDGSKIYYEVKGYLRYEDQVKMKAVRANNPELDMVFIFPEKSKDRSVHRSKMTPEQWCERYGFKCQFIS